MMSEVQHFSESEDGREVSMDSILDTSKLLHSVLTELISELTLKYFFKKMLQLPFLFLPPTLIPCMTENKNKKVC